MNVVLQFVGGLAFFLYGMFVMGTGLEKASGGRLASFLSRVCASTWKGILCGALVTALIQSSSATTVMVVGFVNSGIMTLSQAVGVIMGANLGTTFTSWLLSLSGVEGETGWLTLLKPTFFAPILAMAGAVLVLQKKRESLKISGTILVGFAILMSGMEAMSGAAAPLAESDAFRNMTGWFENPVLGILCGTLMTAILQSSSAAVGVLQALTVTGGFSYQTAIPIVMGQNIGTCITALLSGIGATVNAKRASLVHLYFNVIGSAALMLVFFGVRAFGLLPWGNQEVGRAGIAAIHTVFNLLSSFLLFPFAGKLEKLAVWSVPEGKETAKSRRDRKQPEEKAGISTFRLLDQRFLRSPSFAFAMGKIVFLRMMSLSCENLKRSVDFLTQKGAEPTSEIWQNEKVIDAYEDDLSAYLLKISGKSLRAEDARQLGKMLTVINDVERIGDHATALYQAGTALQESGSTFSDPAWKDMNVFLRAVREITAMTCQAYTVGDKALAQKIEPLRAVVDQMRNELMARHIQRLQNGECLAEHSGTWTAMLTDGVRVAAHCSNLALSLMQRAAGEGSLSAHAYTGSLSYSGSEFFARQMAFYRVKYKI